MATSDTLTHSFGWVKIEIFIPENYVKILSDELSNIDVGHIGNYDHCMSVTSVKGYWRPLAEAHPFQGKAGELCEGTECKVEGNCKFEQARAALKVIHKVHPYEEPVINVIPLISDMVE